jgi:hypothetical protein
MIEWRLYRTRPGDPKQAHLVWQTAEYHLSWGIQRFDGPHMRVIDLGGDYGVDLQVFFATHQPIPSLEHHYLKVAKVRAYITIEPVTLITAVNGSTEMVAIVPIGAVIVQNPSGEEYAMSADEFERRYMLDE